MSRDAWRVVATVAFLATAWLWLVPYASSGDDDFGDPVNCGPALFGAGSNDLDHPERDSAGCPQTSAVRLQQGLLTLLFGAGVRFALAHGATLRKPKTPEPRGLSNYD